MNLCPFVRRARERHAVGNVVGAPEDPNDLAWTMTVASASRRRGQFELPARTEGTTKRLSICCLCRHELFSPTFSPTRLIQTDPASSLLDDLAQPCACCTSIDASGRVAMQKVEGSSPFIRSQEPAGNGGFLYAPSHTPMKPRARASIVSNSSAGAVMPLCSYTSPRQAEPSRQKLYRRKATRRAARAVRRGVSCSRELSRPAPRRKALAAP
jgi:hypothetical protein